MRLQITLILALGLGLMGGCQKRGAAEPFGKTYYLDGAGNWGFGASDVPAGLEQAGYHGDVELYVWTMSFNPLVDQLNIPGARLRASLLARKIEGYHRRFPDRNINMIALSAGTGVATWAIENLEGGARINNLILLGSSLSHDYDMTAALRNMDGKIYVYHSPYDEVLETVKIVGTIDGKRGVSSIGAVGLKPPRGLSDRVVNTPWNRSWIRLGWAGAHTDCTNSRFVRYEIAKHILDGEGVESSPPRRKASVASTR
ncbi:MAG: hypothetical protein GXP29_08760 [Planctomycetes bacterium]|nr:hypothetical protein [Planctomycetota bacterium]